MTTLLEETLLTSSLYTPTPARVVDVRPMARSEKVLTLELPHGLTLGHEPGQFVEISAFGMGEAPISISSSPGRSNGTFELCVRRAGQVTTALHALAPGDTAWIRGPFGKGFPIHRFRGKDMLFLPGGLGLAPLRSLILEVLDHRERFGRVIILYGARDPGELLFREELAQWSARPDVEVRVTVDRADEIWDGPVGVITTLIPPVPLYAANTVAVTCGPPVMYRYVLMELLSKGIREGNIWLSLERRMKCGVGKCGHCQMNHIYTCREGPCFSYAQIKHLEEAL